MIKFIDFFKERRKAGTQKKIFLAVQLNIDDAAFEDFINCLKINKNIIAERHNYGYVKDDDSEKIESFVTEIINSDKDVLVVGSFYKLNDLIILNKVLYKYELALTSVFIPSEERRIKNLRSGQNLYKNLNRWLDFYPGQVEEVYEKYEKTVSEIKSYFEHSTVSVFEV